MSDKAQHRPSYEQAELPHMPPPLTKNRAKDFPRNCKGCQRACNWCDPLGR